MLQLASLGSGSRGNATLIRSQECCVLADCGFSLREVCRRLERVNLDPRSIDAICVTHEHGDHTAGVGALARELAIPVYLSYGTAASGRIADGAELRCFNAGDDFAIGDIHVQSVAVPHDAREPVQYRLEAGDCSVGLLTDLGAVTAHVQTLYQDCDALVLEFNHEPALLDAGPYPAKLKRRIGGALGHLSNLQAAAFLQCLDQARLQTLVLAHASEENNTEQHARAALTRVAPDINERAQWASQSCGVPWFTVSTDTPRWHRGAR